MAEDYACALWTWRHGVTSPKLCTSEREAAEGAVSEEDGDWGSVAGVQFPDGRFVAREEWAELAAERQRRYEIERRWREERAKQPKPATREVRAPGAKAQVVTIPADYPAWVGVPLERE